VVSGRPGYRTQYPKLPPLLISEKSELPPCLFLKKGGVVCGGDSRNVRACRDFRLRPPSMEKSRRPLRGVTRS
jgi:hypothetical protein